MAVRADLNISLDGYATTTDQTPQNPFGEDWGRLVAAYTATRTFRERVLGDPSGGATGVDDRYGAAYFENIGAEIMGAGMFGLHNFPDDAEWRGWWGEEPPFHCPVFVLTRSTGRAPISFANGTEFRFLDAAPEEVLALATSAAAGADVRIGGGVDTVRSFLAAGLVDRLHVGITPILLGRGKNLWADLRGLESDYAVTSEVSESGIVHVTFARD